MAEITADMQLTLLLFCKPRLIVSEN